MTTLLDIAPPLRLASIIRALLVMVVLAGALWGVLAAHSDALDSRVAQTTLVRASAALERNLAASANRMGDQAVESIRNGVREVEQLLPTLSGLGVDRDTLLPVEEGLDALSVGTGQEAAQALSFLQTRLFQLQLDMGDAAEVSDRNVKTLMTAILLGTAGLLTAVGAGAAKKSKRLAAAAAQRDAEQAQELRYTMLAQHASDLVAVVDADSTLQYASPSMTRLLGYDPIERDGRPLLELVAPDGREVLLVAMTDALERQTPGGDPRVPLGMLHKDGHELDCEIMIVNLLAEPTVGGLVLTVYDVSERRAFEKRLKTAAFYDTLTDLPNRELLMDRAKQAMIRTASEGTPTSIVMVDLDQFTAIDSSAGRAVGDAVLQDVARRLTRTIGELGTVARVGGDEFAILTDRDAPQTQTLVDLVLEVLRAPSRVDERELSCRASAGFITISDPGEAAELGNGDVLLARAGTAMREAKSLGGDRSVVYYEAMAAEIEDRLRITADLRRAIDKGDELFLEYQPSYDLRTGVLKSVEALVRWAHPTDGKMPPFRFIGVAERTGLIVPLGGWVLKTACAEAAGWPRAGAHPAPSVSVNVAAAQLVLPTLVDEVQAALAESRLAPDRLILEITESALLEDPDALILRLQEIRDLGVRIAIDDFGTGYSSLAYLQKLPVDILKIDKSFVDGVATFSTDRELASTILAMARNLNLATVAEGVEDADQAAVLRALGYETGQGYLWARPQPPSELRAFLEAGSWLAEPMATAPPQLTEHLSERLQEV